VRAFFITTETNNCDPVMESYRLGPIDGRYKFWCMGARRDGDMVLAVERWAAGVAADGDRGVVMYIGAVPSPDFGIGVPGPDTLRMVRRAAQSVGGESVHICFDGADSPWWPALEGYKRMGCFGAQVNIDGGRCEPADLVTLCPVDPQYYGPWASADGPDAATRWEEKDVRLGFAGGVGNPLRRHMVGRLTEVAGLVAGPRVTGYETPDYAEFARFLRRCRMVLNIPVTGSGQYMHVKSRVLEAGLAGAAVLEHKDSPAHRWFPGALVPWGTMEELEALAKGLPDVVMREHAARLAAMVRGQYSPEQIWASVLRVAGLA